MADPSLPLRSDQHAQHSAMWIVPGFAFPKFCIACAITRLCQPEEVSFLKRKILTEFTAVFASEKGQAFAIFKEDPRVQHRLAFAALDTLSEGCAEDMWEVVKDVLVPIARLSSTKSLVFELLEAVHQRIEHFKFSSQEKTVCMYLRLLSALMGQKKDVGKEFLTSSGGFLEVLLSLVKHKNQIVVQSAVAVTAQLLQDHQTDTLPGFFLNDVCVCVKKVVISAKDLQLLGNLFTILKCLVCIPSCACELLREDAVDGRSKGSVVAVFKRVLLGTNGALQTAGLDCLLCFLEHHPNQIPSLLREDIAELLFEGLKSKDEKTSKTIYTCLGLLSASGEFYANFHSVFGTEPVITNLKAMLQVRNWENTCLGLEVLQNMLKKQPQNMPLFTDASLLGSLVDLLKTLLSSNVTSVETRVVSCLSSLLMKHHVPSSFQLQNILPIMALCQYKFDMELEMQDTSLLTSQGPLTVSVSGHKKTASEGQTVLQEFCMIADNFFSIYSSRGDCAKDEEILSFVLQAFETSIVPYFLLSNRQSWEKRFLTMFSLGVSLMDQLEVTASRLLAKHLVLGGFIQIALEAKDAMSVSQSSESSAMVDKFLIILCCKTIELVDTSDKEYCEEVLSGQMPKLRESLLKCSTPNSVLVGSLSHPTHLLGNLRVQEALLCLVFIDTIHGNRMLQAEELMSLIHKIMTTTPNLTKLPVATLKHLVFVVSVCDKETPSDVKGHHHFQSAVQTLLLALSSLPDPSITFIPHPTPLEWLIKHHPPVQSIRPVISSWLSKVTLMNQKEHTGQHFFEQGPCQYLVSLVLHWSLGCEMLLKILVSSNSPKASSSVVNVLYKVVSHCVDHQRESSVPAGMAAMIEKHIITNENDICSSEEKVSHLFSVLSHIYCNTKLFCSDVTSTQNLLRLAHKAVSLMNRTSEHPQGILYMETLRLLYSLLSSCGNTAQTGALVNYLTGNELFLQRLVGFLPRTSKPKDHSSTSAFSLLVCSALVYHSIDIQGTLAEVQLPTISLLSGLISSDVLVQGAAIQMWSAIFATYGKPRPYALSSVQLGSKEKLKTGDAPSTGEDIVFTLHFILQNLVLSDVDTISNEAATCLMLLFTYLKRTESKLCEGLLRHKWSAVLLEFIKAKESPSTDSKLAELAAWIETGDIHPVSFKLCVPP